MKGLQVKAVNMRSTEGGLLSGKTAQIDARDLETTTRFPLFAQISPCHPLSLWSLPELDLDSVRLRLSSEAVKVQDDGWSRCNIQLAAAYTSVLLELDFDCGRIRSIFKLY